MRKGIAILSALLVLAAAAFVGAQNFNADPLYGSLTLSSGFSPDPSTVTVTAGGTTNASTLGLPAGCVGMIAAEQPDVRVNYTAGDVFPLSFKVENAVDTTLLVNAPDASWHCNDDTNGTNPLVRFDNPQSGQYDIWVGTYGTDTASVVLQVTEL